MVSIHDIEYGSKDLTQLISKFQSKSSIDSWCVCQGGRIFVHPSYYLDQYRSEPSCVDTRAVLPRYEGSCMVNYKHDSIKNKTISNICTLLSIQKMCKASL